MDDRSYVGPVLLLDSYGEQSRMLHESFLRAGFDGPVIVLEYDGFLPDGVISIYDSLCNGDEPAGLQKPCYFNQIKVPDYWAIEATNSDAKVFDQDQLRAQAFYSTPAHNRLVKVVDWFDRNSTVRYTDHYDRFGRIFARTTFDKSGKRFCRTFFSADGKEVVVENFGTRTVSVELDGKRHYYQRKEDLVLDFFDKSNIVATRLFYNSLGTPLFLAGKIHPQGDGHVLFWQEPIFEEVPGNMVSVIEERRWATDAVLVQRRDIYEKLLELGVDSEMVRPMGYVYDFKKDNERTPNALICTNSDEIEKLEELVSELPDVQFNIAALTEMSSKLMGMARFSNVSLFPTASEDTFDSLFMQCDLYLDINHYSEIADSVKRAFLHNQLVLAFESTKHSVAYVSPEHVFDDYREMAKLIERVLESDEIMHKHLEMQRLHALSEDVRSYQELLG